LSPTAKADYHTVPLEIHVCYLHAKLHDIINTFRAVSERIPDPLPSVSELSDKNRALSDEAGKGLHVLPLRCEGAIRGYYRCIWFLEAGREGVDDDCWESFRGFEVLGIQARVGRQDGYVLYRVSAETKNNEN
jgi:hypothetical protein